MRPEDARILTERNIMPTPGPAFFRGEDGEPWFRFVIDSASIIGPRLANRKDQQDHPGAWATFIAAEGVSALDRDAQGSDGGSLPAEGPAAPVPPAPEARRSARRRRG